MSPHSRWITVAVLGWLAGIPSANGQMVTTQVPFQTSSATFYEQSHIGWGIHNPHYFMEFNGGGANPPFGGFQPNSGLHSGFATNHSHFNFDFAQGASLQSTMTTPVLTTTNGFPGLLFIGRERPFVTGVVPQVGAGGFASVPVGPLRARQDAGEFRMENRRVVVNAPERDKKEPVAGREFKPQPTETPQPVPTRTSSDMSPERYFEKAAAAEKEGRAGVARIYYQLARAKGDAALKLKATSRLDELQAAFQKN